LERRPPAATVIAGPRTSGEQVVVLENLENIAVGQLNNIAENVGGAIGPFFLPGIDGVEAEKGRAQECGDQAAALTTVDDTPPRLKLRVEADGINEAAFPEDLGAACPEEGGPDAEDDIVFGKEERVNVGRLDLGPRDRGEDLRLTRAERGVEDAVSGIAPELQIEIVEVAGDCIVFGMGG